MPRRYLNLTGRELTDHEREIGVEDVRPIAHRSIRWLLWSEPPSSEEERIERCRVVAQIAWREGADRVLVDGPEGWLNPISRCLATFGIDVSLAFLINPEGQHITRAVIEGLPKSRASL